MRECPICGENVPHLKKHYKKSHKEEFVARFSENEVDQEHNSR